MVGISYLIFGYRRLRVDPSQLSSLTSVLLRASIQSRISHDGYVIIKEKDVGKTKGLLSGRIEYSISEPLGVVGAFKKIRWKGATVTALVFSVIIGAFLSSLVWDVRVSGNETVGTDEIIEMLSESGIKVGAFWHKVSFDKIETSMLSLNDKLSWVNVNRRGTVAYVRVIEMPRSDEQEDEINVEYANIVANVDCVIEEITVRAGIPTVKPGDTVKKGDVLVLGVLPEEFGGGFCRAEAEVFGRVSDSISVTVEREYREKEYLDREIYNIRVNLFNFSINIFKKSRNLTSSCDIIENEIEYSRPDGLRLPFSLTVGYLPITQSRIAYYSDDELVHLASDRLISLTEERLMGCDLLRISTMGEFTGSGYCMQTDLIYIAPVGRVGEFFVD